MRRTDSKSPQLIYYIWKKVGTLHSQPCRHITACIAFSICTFLPSTISINVICFCTSTSTTQSTSSCPWILLLQNITTFCWVLPFSLTNSRRIKFDLRIKSNYNKRSCHGSTIRSFSWTVILWHASKQN